MYQTPLSQGHVSPDLRSLKKRPGRQVIEAVIHAECRERCHQGLPRDLRQGVQTDTPSALHQNTLSSMDSDTTILQTNVS